MRLKHLAALAFGSKSKKAKTWYKIARRKAHDYGFHVYMNHMLWKEQSFFREAQAQAKNVRGIPDPRSFVLQSCLRSLADIEGDVAECGVRRGRSAIFMLLADLRKRQYHLFDSFAGLPQPTDADHIGSRNAWWKKGDLHAEEAIARNNLAAFPNVNFHVGWIPQTFSNIHDSQFAFAHIDVDLYEPTYDSLVFFYDRMTPGGVIICDDYGSAYCPGARKALDEFFISRPEGIIELPTGQAMIIKRS